MNISVSSRTFLARLLPFSLSELEKSLAIMLPLIPSVQASAGRIRGFPPENDSLELTLLDDTDMAVLNLRYLHCPGPTNILSFPSAGGTLGWMALSVETIWREARIYGENVIFYTLYMLAHALAHLRGHAHGTDMDHYARTAAQTAREYFQAEGCIPCSIFLPESCTR